MKKYHHEDLKKAILEQTLNLVELEGVAGVSTRKISSLLDVSSAAIYRHYENLDALFLTAIIIESDKLAQFLLMNNKESDQPLDKIIKVAHQYVSYAIEKPHNFDFLFLSKYSIQDVVLRFNSEYHTLSSISQLIKEFVDYYDLDLSYDIVLTEFWSFIFGYAILIRRKSLQYDEKIVRDVILKYIKKENK